MNPARHTPTHQWILYHRNGRSQSNRWSGLSRRCREVLEQSAAVNNVVAVVAPVQKGAEDGIGPTIIRRRSPLVINFEFLTWYQLRGSGPAVFLEDNSVVLKFVNDWLIEFTSISSLTECSCVRKASSLCCPSWYRNCSEFAAASSVWNDRVCTSPVLLSSSTFAWQVNLPYSHTTLKNSVHMMTSLSELGNPIQCVTPIASRLICNYYEHNNTQIRIVHELFLQ